ncbi:hypothetical protein AaE_001305, partial [Aphanomyces astaci]
VYICCLDEGPVAESQEEAGDKTVTKDVAVAFKDKAIGAKDLVKDKAEHLQDKVKDFL